MSSDFKATADMIEEAVNAGYTDHSELSQIDLAAIMEGVADLPDEALDRIKQFSRLLNYTNVNRSREDRIVELEREVAKLKALQ